MSLQQILLYTDSQPTREPHKPLSHIDGVGCRHDGRLTDIETAQGSNIFLRFDEDGHFRVYSFIDLTSIMNLKHAECSLSQDAHLDSESFTTLFDNEYFCHFKKAFMQEK